MISSSSWAAQAVAFLGGLSLVCGFVILSMRTIRLCLRAYAAQSILLGIAAFLLGISHGQTHMFGPAFLTIIVKGGVIPWFLSRVMDQVQIKRETEPYVSYPLSILVGVGLTLLSSAVMEPLAREDPFGARGFALALSLMLLGLWLMVGRKKALTQVVGLLMVENGLFVAALSTSFGMPILVELGLAFDLLVGMIVMGLLVFRIQRTFSSINTERLSRLRG